MDLLIRLAQRRTRRLWQRLITQLLRTNVAEVMTPYANSIRRDDDLLDCVNLMIGEHVSALVVEEQHQPVGIITERDFLLKSPLSVREFSKLHVADLMSENVITVSPTDTLLTAQEIMHKHRFRKLVVVEDGHVKGVISQTDLVRVVEDRFTQYVSLHNVMLVETIMNDVITISKTAKFEEAKNRMAKHNIGSILVAHKDEVIGIITEYDIVRELAREDSKLRQLEVQEIMSDPVKCSASDLNIFEANRIMLAEDVRRLPVLINGKLVGIVTQTDLCHHMFTFLRETLERIENRDFGDLKVMVESRQQTIVYQKHGALKEFSLE